MPIAAAALFTAFLRMSCMDASSYPFLIETHALQRSCFASQFFFVGAATCRDRIAAGSLSHTNRTSL
jgi:hypothetical protein